MSLKASMIATLVLTKALEKIGETLGEKALKQASKLVQLLERKSPDTASAIKVAAQRSELVEQQPDDYEIQILVEKLGEAAKSDTEIAAAVEDLADAVKSQPSIVQNFTKTAEKIGNNYQASVSIGYQKQEFNL